ncbi:MAG: cyclase family protein [Terriglobales bacterium]
MRFRSFIIAYALVLAILLFADRRPHPATDNRYSQIVDLTTGKSIDAHVADASRTETKLVAPGALIPGTWSAGEIPAERLIAPLVVMDLNVASPAQISLDDIAAWESKHGAVPPGAVVAIRRSADSAASPQPVVPVNGASSQAVVPVGTVSMTTVPISAAAAQFLMDARYTTGFAIEGRPDFASDRALARQIALHGNYVIESAAHLTALPASGSLIIVAPVKGKISSDDQVRVLAMVR